MSDLYFMMLFSLAVLVATGLLALVCVYRIYGAAGIGYKEEKLCSYVLATVAALALYGFAFHMGLICQADYEIIGPTTRPSGAAVYDYR